MEVNMENDAVFLPGKIHGCDHQIYIIYLNPCSDPPSFEVEILDAERIISLFEDTNGDPEQFFDLLGDYFYNEWGYVSEGRDEFDDLKRAYAEADFILNESGSQEDEMWFLYNWALKQNKLTDDTPCEYTEDDDN